MSVDRNIDDAIRDYIYGRMELRDTFSELIDEINYEVQREIFNEGLLKATRGSLLKLLNYELEIDCDNYGTVGY